MKVLQINATYGIGSTGSIVQAIGKQLEQSGDTALYAYQSADSTEANGIQIGNLFDWKAHALYTRITGKQGYASVAATSKFLSQVFSLRPDVVHLHNLHSNYINLPMLLGFLAKEEIPTVVTLHDCWFFTGKCVHFVEDCCDRWRTGCGRCPQKNVRPRSLFADRSALVLSDRKKEFDDIQNLTVVGCSNWISELAKQSLVFRNRDVRCIHNGIDTGVFRKKDTDVRAGYGLSNRFLVLGMADKWLDPKNLNGVKTLFSRFSDEAQFVIVGVKPEDKFFAKRYPNVIALPFITSKETLADIFNAADVFVNLTHADTLPTVNMESICCGTPVITFDSCGSPELIDRYDGIVVKEGDFGAIGEAIKRLMASPIRFDVERKQQVFDQKVCFSEYLALYHEIAGK